MSRYYLRASLCVLLVPVCLVICLPAGSSACPSRLPSSTSSVLATRLGVAVSLDFSVMFCRTGAL